MIFRAEIIAVADDAKPLRHWPAQRPEAMTETERKILELLGWKYDDMYQKDFASSGIYRHPWIAPSGTRTKLPANLSDMAVLDKLRCEWARPANNSRRRWTWKDSGPTVDTVDGEFWTELAYAPVEICKATQLVPRQPTRIEAMQKAFLAALEAEAGSEEG